MKPSQRHRIESRRQGRVVLILMLLGFAVLGCSGTKPSTSTNLGPLEARDWLARTHGAQLIDVRTPEEYALEHLAGSKLIPLQELETRAGEIDKDKPVLLYCHSGKRSQKAEDLLRSRGFKDPRQIAGGITAWKEKSLPVEASPPPKP